MNPLENPFFNKIQNKLKNKITGIVSARAFFFLIDTYLVNREKTIGKPKGITPCRRKIFNNFQRFLADFNHKKASLFHSGGFWILFILSRI